MPVDVTKSDPPPHWRPVRLPSSLDVEVPVAFQFLHALIINILKCSVDVDPPTRDGDFLSSNFRRRLRAPLPLNARFRR